MRETYPITDQTLNILDGNAKQIATEMDVDKSYIYQILSSVEADPFGKFRRLYAACVRAGRDVTAWDASLASIRVRNECVGLDTVECLSKKIALDADTTMKLVDALRDGDIDDRERSEIRRAIQRERDSLDVLEATLSLSEPADSVRQFARKAVNGRRR